MGNRRYTYKKRFHIGFDFYCADGGIFRSPFAAVALGTRNITEHYFYWEFISPNITAVRNSPDLRKSITSEGPVIGA